MAQIPRTCIVYLYQFCSSCGVVERHEDVVMTISLGVFHDAKGACEVGRDGVGILWRGRR